MDVISDFLLNAIGAMPSHVVLLLVGFVLLIKGADWFVDGAATVAKRLGIPAFIVGLTIVALGTSAPELAVSISASLNGANSLAVSNVIGSNIFNLMVVLGVCSILSPVPTTSKLLRVDYPVVLVSTLMLFAFLWLTDGISRLEGVILLVCLVSYILFTIFKTKPESSSENEKKSQQSWLTCIVCIIIGALCVVIGGDFVVEHARQIGLAAGMSEPLVGLTICAVGTSLPELVASIVASRKGENDMAMGNVIGSNIFNILCILGVSSVASPIAINPEMVGRTMMDCLVYVIVCIVVYIFCYTQYKISRAEGAILVVSYFAYMTYVAISEIN